MGKFCGKCGAEIKEDFCTNCGTKAEASSKVQVSSDMNEYFKGKMESKRNHKVYRIVTGSIMAFLGLCLIIASCSEDAMMQYEDLGYNISLAFAVPGVFILLGGIFSICSFKCNPLLLVSAILYAFAGICNIIGIEDVSLLLILCLVFVPINIVFFLKTQKSKE
ncbi:MAG: hypothetical protein K6G37_01745 [Bacilli bacterium]|nr:hypothetical protein [Bacilli bacterium]